MNKKKPDLSTGSGILIGAYFIASAVQAEMRLHLMNSPLSAAEKVMLRPLQGRWQ